MPPNPEISRSRTHHWSLVIGGALCFVVGVVVLLKSQQAPIPRSFILLVSVFVLSMGIGKLLNPRFPEWSSRFIFIGKVFAGFAIFSISWAISHL
jgi:hypothetical protein